MSTIYLFQDDDRDGISISSYPADSEEYETNHIIVKEPSRIYLPVTLNVLRNVLSQAGVHVVME